MVETTAGAIATVLEAIEALETVGEQVGDDAQYVIDLGRAWRQKLTSSAGGARSLTTEQAQAVELVVAEAASITDPHKAIDWLSTLPQIVQSVLEAG
jgi:hypothetical protein